MTGHSGAAAGLDPPLSGPQLDGSLRGQRALGVRVGVGAGAQGVTPLEEAEVGAVGDGSRVWSRSRLTHPQLGQGEVPPCGRDSGASENLGVPNISTRSVRQMGNTEVSYQQLTIITYHYINLKEKLLYN